MNPDIYPSGNDYMLLNGVARSVTQTKLDTTCPKCGCLCGIDEQAIKTLQGHKYKSVLIFCPQCGDIVGKGSGVYKLSIRNHGRKRIMHYCPNACGALVQDTILKLSGNEIKCSFSECGYTCKCTEAELCFCQENLDDLRE
jgi:hypothetical protein